jgi:hypothetical protein
VSAPAAVPEEEEEEEEDYRPVTASKCELNLSIEQQYE